MNATETQSKENFTRQVHILNPPERKMLFYVGHELVGLLDWQDGIMKFEGNATDSAKMFVDMVIDYYNVQYPVLPQATETKI